MPTNAYPFEENSANGVELFYSDDRDEFLKLLIDFVNELAKP
jgi:hypothetical protein